MPICTLITLLEHIPASPLHTESLIPGFLSPRSYSWCGDSTRGLYRNLGPRSNVPLQQGRMRMRPRTVPVIVEATSTGRPSKGRS